MASNSLPRRDRNQTGAGRLTGPGGRGCGGREARMRWFGEAVGSGRWFA